jgi:hypothetical protein
MNRAKRHLDSWIDGYLAYTDGLSSPTLFRKWAAITTIGACLERRVWCTTAKQPNFPNLFVILVGRPGVGKSKAIGGIRNLIRATKVEGIFEPVCNLAPVDVTKSSLYDYLASKKVRRSGPDPEAEQLGIQEDFHYHSAYLAVSELSDLIRDHDTQLLGAMHSLFDCLPYVEEERRYRADNPIKIPRPQISLIGGTTPAYISRTFPPQAWDEGFMARSILIYSSDHVEPDLFAEDEPDPLVARELVEDLRQIGKITGRMIFTDAAKSAIKAWQSGGKEPAPNHVRLEHYKTRRMVHALKLATIAAANRSNRLIIDIEDFQQALGWMIEAENAMPQVFMEMVGKSDGQVMNELYYFVRTLWDSPMQRQQPVRRGMLVNFLRNKVPAWQIDKVLEAACEAELIQKTLVGAEIKFKPFPKPGLYKKH